MNWFYNNEGLADGPHDEETMNRVVTQARTLVWHTEMEAWQEVAHLKPDWWHPVMPKLQPRVLSMSASRTPTGALSHRSPVPMAPTQQSKEESSGGGFLKRLFGRGKK